MGWLDNSVAIVTGGVGGIGRAVAERYLAEGARVVILDRDHAAVEHFRRTHGDNADGIAGDVTSWDDNRRAVDRAVARFGRLDVFVGNAGVYDFHKPLRRLHGTDISDAFDDIFAVNVKAYLLGARAALDALTTSRGCMIFTASNSALYAGGGGALYVASKHAVTGLIRQLAYELAPLVRVNGVAPGATRDTNLGGVAAMGQDQRRVDGSAEAEARLEALTPLGFVAQPADHAGAYVFLASRANASAITAAIVTSDGGWEIRPLGRAQ